MSTQSAAHTSIQPAARCEWDQIGWEWSAWALISRPLVLLKVTGPKALCYHARGYSCRDHNKAACMMAAASHQLYSTYLGVTLPDCQVCMLLQAMWWIYKGW